MKRLPRWADATLEALGWMDDRLESIRETVARYQRFHGLDVTGDIDDATGEHIRQPRFCALPDVMPVGATLAKWPKNRLRYIITGWLPGVPRDDQRAAYAAAWGLWSAVADVAAEETSDPNAADVVMGMRSIDGPMGVLAESELANGRDSQKRQWYDTGEHWAIGETVPRGRLDLVRVACHEIGHVLGMGHIGAGNLLAPTYSESIRKPQAGDIREMVARYGAPKAVPRPKPDDPPTALRRLFVLEVFEDGTTRKVG